jgi:hypothetical protein
LLLESFGLLSIRCYGSFVADQHKTFHVGYSQAGWVRMAFRSMKPDCLSMRYFVAKNSSTEWIPVDHLKDTNFRIHQ